MTICHGKGAPWGGRGSDPLSATMFDANQKHDGGLPQKYPIRRSTYSGHSPSRGLVILLYKRMSRSGGGGSEKGSRRVVPVR